MMRTMAMVSSSLNPDAPMFIPAAFRRVENYSPEWWELVKTTAWFRDHWFHQHQLYEDLAAADADADVDDLAALLPDDSVDLLDAGDLFYAPPLQPDFQHRKPAAAFGGDVDAVLRTLAPSSPTSGGAVARAPRDPQPRHGGRSAQYVGAIGGGARRRIHQPR